MKKFVKDMLPAFIIGLIISFMMFVYEPIIMFLNNPNDLWFNINTLLPVVGVLFVICLFVVFIIYLLTYFVTKKVIRKDKIFKYASYFNKILFIIKYDIKIIANCNKPKFPVNPITYFIKLFNGSPFVKIYFITLINGSLANMLQFNCQTYKS